jgi:thiol-disulfide isomerase/thioredoxin
MLNKLAVFFPQTLYGIDTLISYIEPYWKVIKETNNRAVVSFTINDAPKEISDIRAEFTVGSLDFLPYKTYQESVYMKADKIIQEQTFSDYSFPDPMQLVAPGYFTTYEKDLQYLAMTAYSEENEEDTIVLCQFLPDIQLYDISGNPFNLPDSGLILLDFWYVGCAPCMKSAVIIEKLYSEYKKDIGFFSVNETDRDTAKIHLFTSKMGISFPVLRCSNEKIAPRVTGNNAYPVFILLDGRTRKILWKLTGYTENLYELIINSIEQYR